LVADGSNVGTHLVTWRPYKEFSRVYMLQRETGRCPAADFLAGCQTPMVKRFNGSFGALIQMGADYVSHERFRPLKQQGRPLWEFKEHDHRLYCIREVNGKIASVVLLNGWVKDKAGKANTQEAREIAKAKSLYEEYQLALKN
jgi:hypothetical protein